jgi:conjugal transfer pilus assembly protein TraF
MSAYTPLFLFTALLYGSLAYAGENYYYQHSTGWHWYNEKVIAESIKKAQKQEKEPQQQSSVDPTKEMSAVRIIVERALNKAILNPTVENVQSYLILQNKVSNQSTKFANVWQKALLEHPELNYSLGHPTNAAAKQIYLDSHNDRETQVITEFFKNRGLFFFYKTSCPYCQKFAPIVKNFASRHGISIIPITIDGRSLPEFPNSKSDIGQAAKFNINITPALFAVNPYNDKALPVAYGFISESDLRQRILDIATDFKNNL